jgi:hypothetical protein
MLAGLIGAISSSLGEIRKLRGPGLRAITRRLVIAGAAAMTITAVAALAPGGPAARAASFSTPAITVADGNSVIAMQTSGNGLRFYWNEHGTNTWHGEQVAEDGNSVVIAAQGAGNSLDFYWQPNGGTGWNPETVAGQGTTYSAPSVMQDGSSVVIAAQGASNSLDFYWAANGTTAWHQETVAGAGTTFSAASQTMNGNSVNIAAEGPGNSLDFYWAANGSSMWTQEIVAGAGTTTSAPAITVNDGSVNVVALNGNVARTEFYWALNGTTTWHPQTLPGVDGGAPAITTDTGGVHVADREYFGQLADKSTSNGTGTWQWTGVGVQGGSRSDPAVTMNDGSENIAEVGSDGNLYFYWQDSAGQYIQEVVDTSANL